MSSSMSSHWLGVDTGGTFTDFVYFDGDSVRIHKVLSTPDAPERAILQGISELQVSTSNLHVIHGSTVATNAVLEGRGVKTAYVTNRGFRDVLQIGRQARRELYNLMPSPRAPLVPPDQCLEVETRLTADGQLLQALAEESLESLVQEISRLQPDAVAINLLFSFLDDSQEQAIMQRLAQAFPGMFVCCSSQVLAEHREYERGMATALNAYVGPLMQGYLKRLSIGLASSQYATEDPFSSLAVMQSSGGTVDAERAGDHAVSLLLSGPAGGLKGAQYVAKLAGEQRLLSFDMGGTSTDVALMDGEIKLTSEASIGDYPVAVPMVDMHTIGAGGGSIAFVDAGGLLNVGPRSAGASPGPACYGKGGVEPTVTDANLVLGRLRADGFLGKGMSLDKEAAMRAMRRIAEPLGLSIEEAAEGVVRIANEHMVRALRTISVQKGYDPKTFALTCFGGAAGLHVCALADALHMTRAIVPVYGGVLSALGMLVSEPSRELSHSMIQLIMETSTQQLEQRFAELEARGMDEMKQELVASRAQVRRSVDLRYRGQSFTLNLELEPGQAIDLVEVEQAFHQQHKKNYGHALAMPVELVNVRVSIRGERPPFRLNSISHQPVGNTGKAVDCYGYQEPVRIYYREELARGQQLQGPALVLEKVSTTLIDKGWHCRVDDYANLLLVKML